MSRREYVLLYAPIFVIGVCFVILGTLYTIFPELLEHTPVSFETRGPIHHLWHYLLLLGGFGLVIGIWIRHLQTENWALWICGGVVMLNFVALIAEDIANNSTVELSGMDAAARIVVLLTVVLRLYAINVANPKIARELSGSEGINLQFSREKKEGGDRGR